MANKLFLVKLKVPSGALHQVPAVTAEVHGDHLVLINVDGKLAALYVMENIESWSELTERESGWQ